MDVRGGDADRRYEDSRADWKSAVFHSDVTLLTPDTSGNGNSDSGIGNGNDS